MFQNNKLQNMKIQDLKGKRALVTGGTKVLERRLPTN